MAQTSCQLASGYPGRGVAFPGCHITVTTHWTHRHPPPSLLGISTASCGCLPMARSNEGIPKPPVCTDDRGQEQGHREIASQRLEPCSSSPAVGSRITMHPSFVPGCGGRYVFWPTRAAGSRQAPAPLLPTHGASIIALFLRMAFAVIERPSTQHAVLCIFPDVIIMLKHIITARLRRRVSSPVHSTVIFSPDVCLTLFDAMQMSPDRGSKRRPRQVGTDGTILERYSARRYGQRLCSLSQKSSSARMSRLWPPTDSARQHKMHRCHCHQTHCAPPRSSRS